jgi:hypothetical protein
MGQEMTVEPPLEVSDWQALTFYFENATAFVQEFGLMSKFMDGLKLSGPEYRVFLAKLSKIHGTVLEMRAEEIEKRSK